jgi:hypothetical protein
MLGQIREVFWESKGVTKQRADLFVVGELSVEPENDDLFLALLCRPYEVQPEGIDDPPAFNGQSFYLSLLVDSKVGRERF